MTYATDNEMVADKFIALLGGEKAAEYWWSECSETWVFDIGNVRDDSPLVAFANSNDMLEGDHDGGGTTQYSYYIEDADVAEKFRNLVEGVNEEDMDDGVMFMLDGEENKRKSVKRFMKKYAEYIEES